MLRRFMLRADHVVQTDSGKEFKFDSSDLGDEIDSSDLADEDALPFDLEWEAFGNEAVRTVVRVNSALKSHDMQCVLYPDTGRRHGVEHRWQELSCKWSCIHMGG